MDSKSDVMTGGCLCGKIRYQAAQRMTGVLVCHCRMCQQATGSAFFPSALYPRETLEFTVGEPTWYASSEIAERGFCSACGTQLFVFLL